MENGKFSVTGEWKSYSDVGEPYVGDSAAQFLQPTSLLDNSSTLEFSFYA